MGRPFTIGSGNGRVRPQYRHHRPASAAATMCQLPSREIGDHPVVETEFSGCVCFCECAALAIRSAYNAPSETHKRPSYEDLLQFVADDRGARLENWVA